MKIQSLAIIAISTVSTSVNAFCPPSNQRSGSLLSATANNNKNNVWGSAAAAAVMGWTLVSQIAVASPLEDLEQQQQYQYQPSSTIVVSSSIMDNLFEKEPEPTYEKLDFSLPTYGAATKAGFGEGKEAKLGKLSDSLTDPGAGEAEKQAAAMRKAEEARQQRKAEQKEALKRQQEQDKIREAEKKAERERRMRGIFE
mmetsp:Transcript_17350/g.24382  ORF Transcript_17350/g.24382 Transcript_17350/m.24382 type:complete len:198 (-) Transcript_17350:234-827(-)